MAPQEGQPGRPRGRSCLRVPGFPSLGEGTDTQLPGQTEHSVGTQVRAIPEEEVVATATKIGLSCNVARAREAKPEGRCSSPIHPTPLCPCVVHR